MTNADFYATYKITTGIDTDPKKIAISADAFAQCEVNLLLIDAIKHLTVILRSKNK